MTGLSVTGLMSIAGLPVKHDARTSFILTLQAHLVLPPQAYQCLYPLEP